MFYIMSGRASNSSKVLQRQTDKLMKTILHIYTATHACEGIHTHTQRRINAERLLQFASAAHFGSKAQWQFLLAVAHTGASAACGKERLRCSCGYLICLNASNHYGEHYGNVPASKFTSPIQWQWHSRIIIGGDLKQMQQKIIQQNNTKAKAVGWLLHCCVELPPGAWT